MAPSNPVQEPILNLYLVTFETLIQARTDVKPQIIIQSNIIRTILHNMVFNRAAFYKWMLSITENFSIYSVNYHFTASMLSALLHKTAFLYMKAPNISWVTHSTSIQSLSDSIIIFISHDLYNTESVSKAMHVLLQVFQYFPFVVLLD